MKISAYLHRCALSNTWHGIAAIIVFGVVLWALREINEPGIAIACGCAISLTVGWCLALWSAVWIAHVAEDDPEMLD